MTTTTTMTTAKAFIAQVRGAAETSQGHTPTICGLGCTRFWVQGVVVDVSPDGTRCVVDDGSGVLSIDMNTFLRSIPAALATPTRRGDLVMVIGPLQRRSPGADNAVAIVAHQVIALGAQPQAEAAWFLEVIEFWGADVAGRP